MIEFSTKDFEELYSIGLSKEKILTIIDDDLDDDFDFYLEILKLQGLNLIEKNGFYHPKQFFSTIKQSTFCIVDIETNGSNYHNNQIIEIGAVTIKNGKTIDTFTSLLHAKKLPESIAHITGIKLEDLLAASSQKEIMHQFRDFIEDHIIVAHPLKFDFEFLSASFEKADISKMLNIGVCNISLAKKALKSEKYGLQYLNQTFNIEKDFKQHRALNDAIITKKIFLKAIDLLPKKIVTVRDLFEFIKS